MLVAGTHLADAGGSSRGNPVPLISVPNWGTSTPLHDAGLLARLTGQRLQTGPGASVFADGFE